MMAATSSTRPWPKISTSSAGEHGNGHSWWPSVSENGDTVVFSANLVSGDTNSRKNTFLRDRLNGAGTNFIVLEGSSSGSVGSTFTLSWFTARPNADYWLYYSLNLNGYVFMGHSFDIGTPQTLLDSGTINSNGHRNYTSPPLPPAAAGLTVYCEAAVFDSGLLYDSNVLAISGF
ncbi:MAG: hypothetical protein HQ519_16805 [Planctomycetes bacterium]|nr:hypothetical protein [Planctomycetota bacterium]